MKRCIRCNCIWVCWNWFESPDHTLHECWNCAASWSTPHPIKWGIPYWFLRYVGVHFVDHDLFDKNLSQDLASVQDWLDDDSWDDDKNTKSS
jgi:hypothetical protein